MTNTTFPLQVSPRLPAAIERLAELASNFWFSWDPPTRQLFSQLDEDLWGRAESNPKLFLRCVDQGILERAAEDATYISAYRKVLAEFDAYLERAPRAQKVAELGDDDLIAYFCAEYGFHESFPIYSGGLGILAGDHCKTASDMRIPFVAVGILYRQGYFNQRIDRHGQQLPEYRYIDPASTPLAPALAPDGSEIRVECAFPGRAVTVRVWRTDVGRVPVFLLDTDAEENSEADRQITRVLYGGDRGVRLEQEVVLGVGGVRALRAAGMNPTVWHMNEGHAAFIILERLRELTKAGVPFGVALEATAAGSVFTTHTPVAAGHDSFPNARVAEHFQSYFAETGITAHELTSLGGVDDQAGEFNMTRLAIRGAALMNGVSRIHGRVASESYGANWPQIPRLENPVGYVTNGVHVPTYMRPAWAELLDQNLGAAWRQRLMERSLIEGILDIPDGRFWYTNQQVKIEMLHALRARLVRQYTRNGVSEAHIRRVLRFVDPEDPNVLTIGFARRFATYKRATLLFTDLEWLQALVQDPERPVIFVFGGKAHPADEPGQWMMREIHRISGLPAFSGKVLLVEGYDAGMSRLLTSGVDVWLGTPVHPFEASGTSGMKAAINGTVNLSVLDGWWAEAYERDNGWGIPPSIDHEDAPERDRNDAVTLYEILQDEVIPLYYARDEKLGHSPDWVRMCKRSMVSVLPHFNSRRVMDDYVRNYYALAARQGRAAADRDFAVARELVEWKAKVRGAWPGVELRAVSPGPSGAQFNDEIVVEVDVSLNGLRPGDVRVECVLHRQMCSELTVPVKGYSDNRRSKGEITYVGDETALIWVLGAQAQTSADTCRYRLECRPPWAGVLSYEIRAVPQHAALSHPYEVGLMRWI